MSLAVTTSSPAAELAGYPVTSVRYVVRCRTLTHMFEQGERGERFYIVESGRAEVVRDGRVVETLDEATASARSPWWAFAISCL